MGLAGFEPATEVLAPYVARLPLVWRALMRRGSQPSAV
jgi:hypothetical protein